MFSRMKMINIIWCHVYIYIYIANLCHAGEFPNLTTRVNAPVSWSTLNKTPWISQPESVKCHKFDVFSRIEVIIIA